MALDEVVGRIMNATNELVISISLRSGLILEDLLVCVPLLWHHEEILPQTEGAAQRSPWQYPEGEF